MTVVLHKAFVATTLLVDDRTLMKSVDGHTSSLHAGPYRILDHLLGRGGTHSCYHEDDPSRGVFAAKEFGADERSCFTNEVAILTKFGPSIAPAIEWSGTFPDSHEGTLPREGFVIVMERACMTLYDRIYTGTGASFRLPEVKFIFHQVLEELASREEARASGCETGKYCLFPRKPPVEAD